MAAKRTIVLFGGALKKQTATDLGVIASRAALTQAGVKPDQVDQVIFGNVMQTSVDAIYLARHIGLRCEIPQAVPALTVNRLCGSGFQAIINGAEQILLGDAECVLVGGTENMSQAPHVIRGARWGLPLGKGDLEDTPLWSCLTDSYTKMPMAITAENLAEQYKISQEEVDAFSVRSQHKHAEAQERGAYNQEIAPVELKKVEKGTKSSIQTSTVGQIPPLKISKNYQKSSKKTASFTQALLLGFGDGAVALIIASREFADANGLSPIGRLVNWGVLGCDPTIMGIGPVPATKIALQRAETTLEEMELVDVNEAFAPQALAVQKELNIPDDKFNPDGGAIALGHPLAASGARITAHLLYALKERNKKVGLGSACIGGGQGISVIVEAL